MNNQPIAVFDSGVGGLTVMKSLVEVLPNEDFIYLGDTARVPYGSRDTDTITQFSKELLKYLLKYNPKFLVVACNTISATCLDLLQSLSPVPIMGVIIPTVEYALQRTRANKIGVIGTRATIASQVYQSTLLNRNSSIEVISAACPLFVPLIEEDLIENPATREIAEGYLKKFRSHVDTIILGCTHYPLLKEVIQNTVGLEVILVDSALPTGLALKRELSERHILNAVHQPKYTFLFTDVSSFVKQISTHFFGHSLSSAIQKVSLE